MSDLPVSYTSAGPVPLTPEELRAQLVSQAIALSPGLTTDLPGSLIEDVASTDVGALIVCDQARVDLINSVGPLKANLAMLELLAQQAGIPWAENGWHNNSPGSVFRPRGICYPTGVYCF
ncbi:hypothetical protein [Escherichia coli]|uniref:hypothetical protein n=1 Tax=Escherichia coli TaxID=562 RepID=UPI001E45242F|nr:hypothetical protein [Escherichia coli]UEO08958.1 hypothetical protein K9U13_12155 [Escherichia coli]